MNTPGQNANAVAELVFGMMIYLQRSQFDGSVGANSGGVDWDCTPLDTLPRVLPASRGVSNARVCLLAHAHA